MNDGPWKFHTGYLVEGLELLIRKVAYTKYDATGLVRWVLEKKRKTTKKQRQQLERHTFKLENGRTVMRGDCPHGDGVSRYTINKSRSMKYAKLQ
jgi:hypothetical protein